MSARHRINPRNARRQRLALHLHRAGPRPVLEAMLELERGKPLDHVLESFGRVAIETYRAAGASELPIQRVSVVKGGKS
jgi:hypothetical protein